MKIGLVITVKNEERLLRTNLLYHKAIGVELIFVYFDNSTDGSRKSVEKMEGVFCFDSVEAQPFAHLEYLNNFTRQRDSLHTARQCLNIFDASQRSKNLGIDWLLSLDADELFLSSTDKHMDVSTFFKKYKNFDLVQLSVMEVLGRQMHYDNVIRQETLFKTQSRFKNWNDRIYFPFYDPYTNETFKHHAWLGHTMGKCAIKISSNLTPKNVHRFGSIVNSPIKISSSGYVLHYSLYDFEDFKKKFKNIKYRPDVFLNGKTLPRLAIIWRNMVNDPDYDDEYIKAYYQSYLHIDKKKLKRFYRSRLFVFFRREAAIKNISYPKDVINSIT
jgi:hypothetical protein